MPLEPTTISDADEIDAIADGDQIPMVDVSGATPALKKRHGTFTKIAAWILGKFPNPSQEVAETGESETPGLISPLRIAQAIAALSPAGTLHNYSAARAPLVTDDNTDGYAAGSVWVYGTSVWIAKSVATNIAVWLSLGGLANPMSAEGDLIIGGTDGAPARLAPGTNTHVLTLVGGVPAWSAPSSSGPLNNFAATTDPGTGDDTGDGYSVGSTWINVTLDRIWRCTDATLTAAVWERVDQEPGTLNNYAATTNPGVGDDSADGYSVGSRWINLTLDTSWTCTDPSEGAAVWSQDNAAAGMTNPMTTPGDLITGGTSGAPQRLAKGTDGQILKMVSGSVVWAAEGAAALSSYAYDDTLPVSGTFIIISNASSDPYHPQWNNSVAVFAGGAWMYVATGELVNTV